MLKIAIQKSGRLFSKSLELLESCGLDIDTSKDQLKAQVKYQDIEILFLRNSDIPKYVESGIADLAIVGDNVVVEKQADITRKLALSFSSCRLSIASPKGNNYSSIRDLEGKKIATSYPNTLRQFLKEKSISVDVHTISGSVEIAPNIGLADAICDLFGSGSTLFKNNLCEREIISQSQASLYVNKRISL